MSGALDGLPPHVAKLAVWRKGLPQPTTFLVEEVHGRDVVLAFDSAVRNAPTRSTISFETYNDGKGRRSTTMLVVDDVAGLTLEFATLRLQQVSR